ncbi:septal ring lytic transglycosylase RlpA family protein [Ramlibacter sp. WS9]|uniref:septal ring lytic transglycosylase RlpA family protein n=1 Tax=Ramlibacter sp. WS9 TaxID=1882741 RepID=UPI0018EE7A65|nr:septal ring lytic transglycosylase RlpA family protein [Ramlibacter sp. WS9]
MISERPRQHIPAWTVVAALSLVSGCATTPPSGRPVYEEPAVAPPAFAPKKSAAAPKEPPVAPTESAVGLEEAAAAPTRPPAAVIGRGKASWYGPRFHRKRTANGERFDMNELTAAHRTLPFGSLVRVRNLQNGLEVVVRINDRGPWFRNRIIDLSKAAAAALNLLVEGEALVILTEP